MYHATVLSPPPSYRAQAIYPRCHRHFITSPFHLNIGMPASQTHSPVIPINPQLNNTTQPLTYSTLQHFPTPSTATSKHSHMMIVLFRGPNVVVQAVQPPHFNLPHPYTPHHISPHKMTSIIPTPTGY